MRTTIMTDPTSLTLLAGLQGTIASQIRAVDPHVVEAMTLELAIDVGKLPIVLRRPSVLAVLAALATDQLIYDGAAQVRQVTVLTKTKSDIDAVLWFALAAALSFVDADEVASVRATVLGRSPGDPEHDEAVALLACACECDWIWEAMMVHRNRTPVDRIEGDATLRRARASIRARSFEPEGGT